MLLRRGSNGDDNREHESQLAVVRELIASGQGAEALALLAAMDFSLLPDEIHADALELTGDCFTELSRYAEAHDAYLQALRLRKASTELHQRTLFKALCSALRVLDTKQFPTLVQRLRTAAQNDAILCYIKLEVERMAANEKCSWDYYLVGMASHQPELVEELVSVNRSLASYRLEEALESLYPLLEGGRLALWLQAARIHQAIQQPYQAMALLERALEHFPDSWRLHYALGIAAEVMVLHDRAEHHYRRALSLYPNSGEAWFALARVLRGQGLLPQAREAVMESLRWCRRSGFPLALRERAFAETYLVGIDAALSSGILPWRLWYHVRRVVKSLQLTYRFVRTCWKRVRMLLSVFDE
ncbi:MAG: tetratricopeptide repeat protein [Fimbriimonadales bacterium]|jgi:tetratricopeptide (TPR) repeat protein|nr:Tetratricopeptide repeat-containing protein [Armatimonadetes bacterium GXS]